MLECPQGRGGDSRQDRGTWPEIPSLGSGTPNLEKMDLGKIDVFNFLLCNLRSQKKNNNSWVLFIKSTFISNLFLLEIQINLQFYKNIELKTYQNHT